MSSGGSLGTMQRLVEQLKLEAAVERIKVSRTRLRSARLGSAPHRPCPERPRDSSGDLESGAK
ncbi:PREDICTED: guanine nucleotide-binding protein G(I)/G(S)/G(O) subunit gamma-10 [Tinamus guttatus]|uniref:guanine nucleotide-binding protein G(I)/G(S)/G(O) subunit gamma-10 n=1 Tax=Tinamus guttatus TaxID=94827 RepID=UPI00052F223C|nr:PREDICTED: guanine nucleotide-binding protein G(I)/G(S)/G(O) subunit gamma-10 [Tinamus guttatus]